MFCCNIEYFNSFTNTEAIIKLLTVGCETKTTTWFMSWLFQILRGKVAPPPQQSVTSSLFSAAKE